MLHDFEDQHRAVRRAAGWHGWCRSRWLLTLVLLASGGSMARILLTLAYADRIIDPAGMSAIQLSLAESRYPSAEQRLAFLPDRIA